MIEDVFRQPAGWEASLAVVGCVFGGKIIGHVSALTPPVLYFLRRRTHGERAARHAVQQILRGFGVVALDGEAVAAACESPLPDFEDALQLEAAKAVRADALVTRNERHFRQNAITVLSPEELIEGLGEAAP